MRTIYEPFSTLDEQEASANKVQCEMEEENEKIKEEMNEKRIEYRELSDQEIDALIKEEHVADSLRSIIKKKYNLFEAVEYKEK